MSKFYREYVHTLLNLIKDKNYHELDKQLDECYDKNIYIPKIVYDTYVKTEFDDAESTAESVNKFGKDLLNGFMNEYKDYNTHLHTGIIKMMIQYVYDYDFIKFILVSPEIEEYIKLLDFILEKRPESLKYYQFDITIYEKVIKHNLLKYFPLTEEIIKECIKRYGITHCVLDHLIKSYMNK